MGQVGLAGRVTDNVAEQIKSRLSAEFTKEFTKVLTKKGFPVVDDAGAGVLTLRPALVNVNVTAPDTGTSFGVTMIDSAGSMALYMEMYDSATNELIARVIDPQADNEDGVGEVADRATNRMAADDILRHWADLLASHLGSVTQKDGGS